MEMEIIETIGLLKRIHVNIIDNASKSSDFKKNDSYQVVELLHKKIISLVESVIILNRNYKYAESLMVIRNIFETSVFILYLKQYPFESRRWLSWNNLSFEEKEKIPKKQKEFEGYLKDKDYQQILDLVTKDNFFALRNFSPTLIRNMAFKDMSDNGSEYSEFYELVCKFSHPSFVSMAKNDKLDIHSKEHIDKTALFILLESSVVFIWVLNNFIDTDLKDTFENEYKRRRKLLID
ncbi:hypothetical protein J4227_07260 [Candidatus Woesearchaeota archaeon]|nr:hypothetical protein [Candidatus Woesearchaeota archaeon]